MQPIVAIDRSWAILFARLVLGPIFFMASLFKVFQFGPLKDDSIAWYQPLIESP